MSVSRKLILLIICALVLTVAAIVGSATDLFTSDFTQFMRRGSLDTTALLAGRVRSALRAIDESAVTIGAASLEEFKYPEDRLKFLEGQLSHAEGFVAISLYRNVASSHFEPVWRALSAKADHALLSPEGFASLDRDCPLDLLKAAKGEPAFGYCGSRDAKQPALLRIAIPFVKRASGDFSEILIVELDPGRLSGLFDETSGYSAFLTDGRGVVLGSNDPLAFPIGKDLSGSRVLSDLRNSSVRSLQRDYRDESGRQRIGAREGVGIGDLAVVTSASSEQIATTRSELYLRSALLGGIVLFAALALSVYLGGAITTPLRVLAGAADRVAQGDFSARVAVRKGRNQKTRDEVGLLSRSFNAMAERIAVLMRETAEKARMENELKTAKIVQERYFPAEDLNLPFFQLSGRMLASSECGGDWWNYKAEGDRVAIMIGDATGHGASAALVTAAAHSSFATYCRQCSLGGTGIQTWLQGLIGHMDTAIAASSGDRATMTAVVSVLDMRARVLYWVNASHPMPILFTVSKGKPDVSEYKSLLSDPIPSLGEVGDHEVPVLSAMLEPGSRILWFTDGLVEAARADGQRIRKKEIFDWLSGMSFEGEHGSRAVCKELMVKFKELTGNLDKGPEDDVTIAVGIVPAQAQPNVEDGRALTSDIARTA